MKKYIIQFITCIALISSPFLSKTQTLDEIVAKHIDAHGGENNWAKIKSMKIIGRFTAFSEEKEFFSIKTSNGSYYSERHLGQYKVIEAFDGEKGWTIDPWQEITFPRRLNKPEVNVFYQKSQFFTPFYKYKERGIVLEYLGKEEIDGIDAYVIKVTRKNRKSEKWYINSETYLEYKCESEWVDFAQRIPSESFFDDFRTVNGVVLPFYIERIFWQRNRVTQIENIEFNIDVDEKLFEMPTNKEFAKLNPLAGDWDVAMEVWSRRNTWFKVGETTSEIRYLANNLIQEKIDVDLSFSILKISNFTYDESAKVYKVYIFNDFYSVIDVFEGTFTEGDLIINDLKQCSGDEAGKTKTNTQYIIHFIDENSFSVETKISNDKGKNWFQTEKLTYTRKKN